MSHLPSFADLKAEVEELSQAYQGDITAAARSVAKKHFPAAHRAFAAAQLTKICAPAQLTKISITPSDREYLKKVQVWADRLGVSIPSDAEIIRSKEQFGDTGLFRAGDAVDAAIVESAIDSELPILSERIAARGVQTYPDGTVKYQTLRGFWDGFDLVWSFDFAEDARLRAEETKRLESQNAYEGIGSGYGRHGD